MDNQRWDIASIALGAIVLLVLGGWWLESRFNAQVVVMTVGLLFGTFIFIFGAMFGVRAMRAGAETASYIHESTMNVEAQRQKVQAEIAKENREYAKLHVAAGKAEISQQLINYRRADQLAQQRLKLLTQQQKEEAKNEWWDVSDVEYSEVE